MSKLRCVCGHVISDQSDGLSYKAAYLRNQLEADFFEWIVEETQSYVQAAQADEVDAWLNKRGYGREYLALNLSHGNVLHDHIHAKYLKLTRGAYECTECGRIHIERSENCFVSYLPENEKYNEVFKSHPENET